MMNLKPDDPRSQKKGEKGHRSRASPKQKSKTVQLFYSGRQHSRKSDCGCEGICAGKDQQSAVTG